MDGKVRELDLQRMRASAFFPVLAGTIALGVRRIGLSEVILDYVKSFIANDEKAVSALLVRPNCT